VAAAVALSTPTAQAAEPQITDAWVSTVSAGAADLHALVDPKGLATSARFEYLTTAAYQANIAASRDPFSGATTSPLNPSPLGAGTDPVAFLRRLGGLQAATAYRWRLVATNSSGPTSSPTRTFTTTANAPVFSLPDNRGWEMVSPVDKNGGEIQEPGELYGGGLVQAAADGQATSYSSRTSFGSPQASSSASQYVSRRTPSGWSTENVTVPTLAGAFGDKPNGVPYRLFSGDLARGLLATPQRCEVGPCPRGYALRTSASGALASSPLSADMDFVGASPDLSATVLSTCKALTANATEVPGVGGCDPAFPNLYRWSGGVLSAINLLPAQSTTTPGAELAASLGAVSSDGSRIYFTQAGALYLRQNNETTLVDAAAPSFQTASANGALAFFTKADLDGDHLYRFDATTKALTDLTPSGGVEGVLGASPDGSHLYYLTASGLYLHRNGVATKVAESADASNYPPATGTARIAANGTLAFLASAALTDFDSNGTSQVYRYAPSPGALTCASCNPTGSRPLGPSTVPGARANGSAPTPYKPRALSADGNRLFFDSRDSLVVQDTNNDRDVYQWEAAGTGSCAVAGGCIAMISSGRASEGALLLDASADGADVFFLTNGSLVPTDPGVMDVYVARIGGGFPAPVIPIACLGDACQAVPGEPEDPNPGTGFYRPEGNPPLPKVDKAAQRKAAKKRAAKKKAAAKRKAAKKRAAKKRAAHNNTPKAGKR
jgi:Tol biopolymer transport system component